MVTPTPTTVQVKIQLRGDTAANWASVNPILLTNELGLETDTKKIKVGDGTTAWNSLAYFPSIVTGGTVLGNLEIGTTGTLTFEGSTANGFETTLAVTDPTADRTITLPDQSGTVVVTGNASIVDADIAANAEIAVSKLADGAARQLLQTDAAGTGVEWTDNVDVPGTLDVTGAATFDANVTIEGDLTVNGTTTTIDTETLLVKDKNIELAVVETPTDTTADGGGITLKGATDKTITWSDATAAWTLSEHVDLASGKEYRIDGTKVLDATSLGSAVVSSSLTSVGTIGTGVWQGTAIDATYLDSTVVTTSDTGTVTSTMLADGTIVNADVNAAAAIAGTKIDPDFGSQTVETTGVFSAAAGAAATPSITFTGDLNTGIYSPGADQLAISTNGSRRLSIDSDGNICAGSADPVSALDLRNDLPIFTTIRDTGSITADMLLGAFNAYSRDLTPSSIGGVGGVRVYAGATYNTQTTPSYLSFWTHPAIANDGTVLGAAQERARITSDGKLGLGTSSPATLADFSGSDTTVYASSGSSADVPGTSVLTLQNPSGTAGSWTGLKLTATNGGNFRLAYLAAFDDGSGNRGAAIAIGQRTGSASYSERLRIDSLGRVGIGTQTPSQLLHCYADSNSNFTQVLLENANTGGSVTNQVQLKAGTNTLLLGISGSGTSGSAYLGTSQTQNLDLYASGSANVRLFTNASERARIDSSGRLLVGTSTTTGIGLIETPGVQTWRTANTERNVFRLAKSGAGSGRITLLTITVPAGLTFISIEATFIGARATVSTNQGTSRIAKEIYTIARNGSGSDVVLDSNINSLDFEVGTTTAGGSANKAAMSPSIARAGAEPNTDPQVVIITADASLSGGGSAALVAYFDICVLGTPSSIT